MIAFPVFPHAFQFCNIILIAFLQKGRLTRQSKQFAPSNVPAFTTLLAIENKVTRRLSHIQ